MTLIRQRRLAATIIVLIGAMVLTLLFPGLTPWSPTPPADAAAKQQCKEHYYARDPGKESEYSFGPAVASRDGAGIKEELHERRFCGEDLRGDPALTASHYAAWSAKGLTTEKVSFEGVNAFAARLIGDFPLWESTVAEMESLESVSTLTLGSVSPRTPSLYMVAKATGGVEVRQGLTIGDGSAVVFTHPSGAVVRFRLDCGLQNVGDSFPGVKAVPPGSIELMPLPKKTVIRHKAHKPACTVNCSPVTTPTCPQGQVRNDNGTCVVPKSSDPGDYQAPGRDDTRDSGSGTKPRVPVVAEPVEKKPPAVITKPKPAPIVAPGAGPVAPGPVPAPEPSVNPPEDGDNADDPGNPFD